MTRAAEWNKVSESLPPNGAIVETKIDDENGVTAEEAEKRVRERLILEDDDCDEHGFFLVIGDAGRTFTWQQGADYVEAVLAEIARLEEEIDYVTGFTKLPDGTPHPVWQRILSRLTSLLAEEKRGMR